MEHPIPAALELENTMLRITTAAVVAALATLCAPAQAQETPGPSDSARYTYQRVQEGFLRFDVRTGQVSICDWAAIGWYCRLVPDERLALESEVARLQTSNTALKKELVARGLPLPDGIKPDPLASRSGTMEWNFSSDVGLDRVTGYVGKVWRQMMETMVNLQRGVLRRS